MILVFWHISSKIWLILFCCCSPPGCVHNQDDYVHSLSGFFHNLSAVDHSHGGCRRSNLYQVLPGNAHNPDDYDCSHYYVENLTGCASSLRRSVCYSLSVNGCSLCGAEICCSQCGFGYGHSQLDSGF